MQVGGPAVGPAAVGAAAHVFVDDLDQPELAEEDRHHLQRVLRLRAGEVVTVADGRGGWRSCVYRGSVRLEPAGARCHGPRPAPVITIGFALTKGERPEWTVQKLAEAGVDRIQPLATRRSVVRWDGEKATRQVARLNAVARGAAMQSRQTWLPAVNDLADFGAVAAELAGSDCTSGALAELGGGSLDLRRPTVLVGPEGGWADEELAWGLPPVGLGPTVLRAETAALAAGLLLCALRAGTVLPLGGASGSDAGS